MPPDVPARVPLPIAMPDDAFGAALIEQAAALSAYARRLTGGGADADDLLQDTMLRCWTARASFAAGTSLAAWARTVMKNSFLTGRRRARFHADLPEEARDRMLRVDETQSLAVWLRVRIGRSANSRSTNARRCCWRARACPSRMARRSSALPQAHSRAASHAGGLGCAPSSRSDRRRCWPTGPAAIRSRQRPSGPSTCGKGGTGGASRSADPRCACRLVAFLNGLPVACARLRRRGWRRANLLQREPVELHRPGGGRACPSHPAKGVRA